VLKTALSKADLSYSELSAIAVTNRPGLIGSLMVGVSAAKALAFAQELPLIPINHLKAHLCAATLENKINLPAIGLIISGGHTSLFEIDHDWQEFRPLGHTRDDAAGEAFDKGARLLQLPYPGGPALSKAALGGNPNAIPFPRALPGRDTLDFSFSGLKTSLQNHLQHHALPTGQEFSDLCASFQEAIVDALVIKTVLAVEKSGRKDVVVAGGVAANSRIREKLRAALPANIRMHFPSPQYCTDNGAMIATLGSKRFAQKKFLLGEEIFPLEPSPRTEAKDFRGKQK
jgi:N6-L-threonylcarbamoyladenine synthase